MNNHSVVYAKNQTTEENADHAAIAEKIMQAALRQGLHFEIKTQVVDNGKKRVHYRVSASASKTGTCVEGFATSKDDVNLLMNLAIIDGAVVSHLTPPAIKEAIAQVGEPKMSIGVVIDHWRHFSKVVTEDGNRTLGQPDGIFLEQQGFWIGYSDIGMELLSVPDGTPNTGWEDTMALVYAFGGNTGTTVKVVRKPTEEGLALLNTAPALADAGDELEDETRV